MGTGFYGSNDPTNSVKALKEQGTPNNTANETDRDAAVRTYYERPVR